MLKLLGVLLALGACLLLLTYSPLPSGLVKNGFIVGLVGFYVGVRLMRRA